MTVGIPSKVLAKAQTIGVHNDCLVSPQTSCSACEDVMTLVFDFYYGQFSADKALEAITDDLLKERRASVLEDY